MGPMPPGAFMGPGPGMMPGMGPGPRPVPGMAGPPNPQRPLFPAAAAVSNLLTLPLLNNPQENLI